MHRIIVAVALIAAVSPAFAYDKSWYEADYWPGEYPQGFSVKADNVVLKGRKTPNPATKATLDCAVPKGAVYHPWNESREATYRTYSKIVPLTIAQDFVYEFTNAEGQTSARTLTPAEKLEYLVYQGEGYFTVRYQGREFTAGQDLFEHVAPVSQDQFIDDEWVRIPCTNKVEAWILLSDLRGEKDEWVTGLDGPNITEYGKATDLAP